MEKNKSIERIVEASASTSRHKEVKNPAENLGEKESSTDATDEETSKEKNVDDKKVENWVAAAREKMSKLLAYSATRYTRILLISDVDQTLSKRVFREDKRARKVVFMEEPLSGPGWDWKNNCVE